ncbi:hypothetical protein DHW03_05515 [Pedobacter yonginense]|uniref:Uncharacterized protein n=1 Tax=Pedobacter yonginense TaxID=651869 RepID=A0A317EVM9_9SPHI|nr:hypothetical protein [Pedobacter yonginense]PWS29276.1 hypothetical protein DHW03_05515 [Pedobacter yonginense]
MNVKALLPEQKVGKQSDIEESRTFPTNEEAQQCFDLAKARLLDVSNWHVISKIEASAFCLVDATNSKVQRGPQIGDFIRIDVPGPGTKAGKGFDWVKIEHMENHQENADHIFTMRARPDTAPATNAHETTHFFKSEATSNFIVRKHGLTVSAEVHGRNELPNTEADHLIDKARNLAVATGSFLGFSVVQWNLLVKGILS